MVSDAGANAFWELDTDRLDEARGYLERISKRWDSALARLRKYVEG